MGHSSPESSTAEEESKCVVQVKCSEVKVKVCITISTQVNDLCEKHISVQQQQFVTVHHCVSTISTSRIT